MGNGVGFSLHSWTWRGIDFLTSRSQNLFRRILNFVTRMAHSRTHTHYINYSSQPNITKKKKKACLHSCESTSLYKQPCVAHRSRLGGKWGLKRISDNVCVITWQKRGLFLTKHKHMVPIRKRLCDLEMTHHASRSHWCTVLKNQGSTAPQCSRRVPSRWSGPTQRNGSSQKHRETIYSPHKP